MKTQHASGPIAKQLAYSIIPFMQHPPAANHHKEIAYSHAMDIQRALETYWPEMRNERNKLKAQNAELLEALTNLIKFVELNTGLIPSELINAKQAIAKATGN